MRVPGTGVLVALAIVLSSAAGSVRAAEVDDAPILPYLDEGTFVVARLDVERVNQEALGKYMEESTDRMLKSLPIPGNQTAQMKEQLDKSSGEAKTWLTDMAAAGGTHVYFVLDMADVTDGNGDPVVIVPFAPGSDADKIRGVLTQNNNGNESESAVDVGQAVVYAKLPQIERLKQRLEPGAKPVAHPDLARAFAAAGDAPLRIALLPGESTRKWVEDNLPAVPGLLGGGDTKTLSRGVRYATIAVLQKPGAIANLSVRCEDADKAKALLDMANKGLAAMTEQFAAAPQGEDLLKSIETVKPKAEGDTLSVSIDPLSLQIGLMGVQMQRLGQVAPPPAQPGAPAQPPKADDGGL